MTVVVPRLLSLFVGPTTNYPADFELAVSLDLTQKHVPAIQTSVAQRVQAARCPAIALVLGTASTEWSSTGYIFATLKGVAKQMFAVKADSLVDDKPTMAAIVNRTFAAETVERLFTSITGGIIHIVMRLIYFNNRFQLFFRQKINGVISNSRSGIHCRYSL
jgi:hypothetical protein